MHADNQTAARASVELSLRQFVEAWRVIGRASARYVHHRGDGIEYVFSGIPIAFFNIALLTEPGMSQDRLKAHAGDACAWASDKAVPWFFITTEETLEPGVDATAVLDACGLAPVMPLTGMVAEQIAPAARPVTGLELSVPQESASLAEVIDVNALAYGLELDAGKPIMTDPGFWRGHVPVLGRVGGKPASSAAVLMVDGYRYVALVATDPAHQRRGYAEAAMRHALDVAAQSHGPRSTVLHATAAGRPIYERMGYATIANHTVYMEKRFLEEH